jgi:hypothetical protein
MSSGIVRTSDLSNNTIYSLPQSRETIIIFVRSSMSSSGSSKMMRLFRVQTLLRLRSIVGTIRNYRCTTAPVPVFLILQSIGTTK